MIKNILSKEILVPRNLEGRKVKLRQDLIKLLSQEVIEGNLIIDESFEGIDDTLVKVKEIKGYVKLSINKGYIPEWLKDVKIYGDFDCCFNDLTSLENCPDYIAGHFYCSFNNLNSLKNGPKYVKYNYVCCNNQLTSLDGCPTNIFGFFNIDVNKLTSLKNCPQYVGETFYCRNNQLTSLKDCPKYIEKHLWCRGNKIKLELPEGVELKGKFHNA